MRRGSRLTLILVTLFILSLAIPLDLDFASDTNHIDKGMSKQSLLSEGETTYSGIGAALDVLFSGTFANASGWSDTGSTLSNLLTPGVSFTVENATTVTWVANVLVSPPADISTVSFSVNFPVTDWKIVSVADPVGVARSSPSDWYQDYDQIVVTESAVDTYGLWKLTFTASNHLTDLEMGQSGGPYSSVPTTFDTGDTMHFGVTSSWITGASAEFDLIDPTGSVWYSASNTTSGSISHALPSYRYHKDITIHNGYVTGDFVDFPVLIDIIDTDLHTDVQADGDDIVFYSNGVVLAHEIELFDQNYSGTEAHLIAWVKANLSNTVDTIITMYYGNPDVGPQENPTEVWTSNYSAVWHLGEDATDEGTSTDHLDSTGNGYYGDQDGNNDVTGVFGVGQNFDGTNDIINVSSARGLEPSGDVTISGWFKLDSAINQNTGTTQTILTKAIDGDTDMHVVIAGSDYVRDPIPQGAMVFKMENGGLGQLYVWSLRRSWVADTWYYFTCTMDASSPSNNRVFINGADNTNSTTGSLATASLAFTDDWVIGGGYVDQTTPTEKYFDGVIDEVRVTNSIRGNLWVQTEWLMYQSMSSFRTLALETAQTSPDLFIEKALDTTAPSGLWTVAVHYNDSGSSVTNIVGEYARNFIVRRSSTLAIDSPSDAAAGLETMTVGDMLYLVVDLSDTNNANPVTGATVSMNWSVSGVPTIVYFEDLGDGRYSAARNTSELSDRQRYRIDIDSTHPYYFDASDSFDLDLYHPTELRYEWVTTTPVGYDVDATLVYVDTWDGSLISGATITLNDGTPVTSTAWGLGRYNVTIDADTLPIGEYFEIFNASNSANLYEMASANVTYVMRAHYTAATVTGNLETPFGQDTTVNIVLVDLDTGSPLTASVVSSLSFDSSYGTQNIPTVTDLIGLTLTTNSWSVGTTSVDLSIVMSDSDYFAPSVYAFDVEIRNHLTATTVLGNLTTAYGEDTTITVSLTDLDGGTIGIGSVTSFTFTSSQGVQVNSSLSSFTLDLKTNSWPVSTIQVTISVVLSGNYDNPTNYQFNVIIRSLQTTLYNAPSDLIFTQGSDFSVDLHFNVSEDGPYNGVPINGEAAQFVISPYPATITPLGNGMYRITIAWSNFDGQGSDFTIDIDVNPSSNLYASASLVVSFRYREIISDLTANLYTVSTPYNKDVTIYLYYTDRDAGTGITTATISANPSVINSQSHIANGQYEIVIDVSSFGIGSHDVNFTASASGYQDKWVIITVVITQTSTNLNPETIRLEIPSGNTVIFTLDWIDLVNSIPIDDTGTVIVDNWNGTAPVVSWTGTEYEVTFVTTTSDALGTYLLWFNFTNGVNYQPGYCEIQVEIRSHDTILTAESPPPTAINALINISVYYYDFDNKVGIDDFANVQEYVYEGASPITSTLIDDGNGYYIVQIDASTLGSTGVYNFTVFINWTGVIQQYENKFVYVSVTVVGADSQLALSLAADPTAYSETMTYEFVYNERDSGIGITNSTDQGYGTGHVHIYISFDVGFDPAKLTITEVNAVTDPGLYRVEIDTTGFGQIGQFLMSITIDWDDVDPYYTTRVDSVSVVVLARDTLLLINPPSPESYGETATFSFSWEDTGTSTNILDSAELDVTMNITFGISHNAGVFTVTFNTNQFGSIGSHIIVLNVTWAGEPFYSNRTNRLISITVLNRQTVLDYPTPDPTFYDDNVTITITWTDVTNGGSDGILSATIIVTDDNGVIPSNEYDIRAFAGGIYEIEFDTSRFATPGIWNITVQVSVPATYIADKTRWRLLDIRERATILSYEAVGKVAYGDPISFVLYYNDLYTTDAIGNGTGDVTLEILTAGTWVFTSTWNGVDEQYDIVITSYPSYPIGTPFNVQFRMSYDNVAPFYASDDFTGSFELRARLSLLSLEVAPNPTPYLDDAVFLVQFLDVDADTGISADYFEVYFGMTQLTLGTEYTTTPLGGGFFELSVNSTVFGTTGLYGISVYAYWTSGAPYHNNASVSVNIRVTTRDTIIDLTTQPTPTPFQDDVTFTFEYVDLFRGTAITSILSTDITLYKNGTLVDSGDYTLTPFGSGFIFTVDSETLGSTLGRYNLTIIIDWNEATSPYYVDAQTTTWVTVTTRTLSFTLEPLDETDYGHIMNITFSLSDIDTGVPVDGAIISFSAQTVSLTQGDDYNITPLLGGDYLIEIDTIPFGAPGDFLFNLDISWNPSTSPYYKSMNTIILTGVISDIETELTTQYAQITADWGGSADMTVYYRDLIWSNPISDAVVEWQSNTFGVGSFSEVIPGSGNYSASFFTDINNADAGTYIISITAMKDDYVTARAYITVVVQPLDSNIVLIDPNVPVFPIDRGAALTITIHLEDESNNPIADEFVISNQVLATVEGGGTYILAYTGTPGEYSWTLPANDEDATKKAPGSYTIVITAGMTNYEPSAYSFKILVLQTATEVQLTGGTTIDMSRTYTENVTVYVQVVLPDLGYTPFWNATVTWAVVDTSINGTFTHLGNGNFSAIIQTTEIGFGIWNIIFKATPFENATIYAGSQTTISFAVRRIQTSSIPPGDLDFIWGWSGYLQFIFWDETFDQGIAGADVTIEIAGLENIVTDVENGTYLVFLNTSLLQASEVYIPVPVSFEKANYAPSSAIIQIRIREVPTDIYVSDVDYTPDYSGELPNFEDLDTINLEIPYGDSMVVSFFYNDTDNSEGFLGGLAGAFPTANSYLRGPTFDGYFNVTLIDLGNGLYQVSFDTLLSGMNGRVDPEAFRLNVEMGLGNRSTSTILFRITIIDIPTELSIVNEQPVWNLVNGETLTIELLYMDTWHNIGIENANFSATTTSTLFTVDTAEDPTPGHYLVSISSGGIKFAPGSGTIIIRIGDGVYTVGGETIVIELSQNGTDVLVLNSILYGLPIGLILALLGFVYVRVWSVPKRLRQINGQIKAIRKGKIPKPIEEAATRQELIAGLFNDTFAKLEITRTPDQMPEESIPVEVPELGELVIQLAILTNLDQDELDDFKADIAKMKISEQAAFVKEVIVQEAIRAARRDGKTVEQVLEEVEAQAATRLAGEAEGEAPEGAVEAEEIEPDVETVILPDKDKLATEDTPAPSEHDRDFETQPTTDHLDKLSPYEIEELKKDLESKGVPAHEIDTIVQQAKELSRDLVEELVRSLERDKGYY